MLVSTFSRHTPRSAAEWSVLNDTSLGVRALDEPGLDLVLGLAIEQSPSNGVRSSQRTSRR